MIYNIKKYYEAENTPQEVFAEAVVDSSKAIDEQTMIAQQYIYAKENIREVCCSELDDGHNRISWREYEYVEGFNVVFGQNYKDISWELASESVLLIKD